MADTNITSNREIVEELNEIANCLADDRGNRVSPGVTTVMRVRDLARRLSVETSDRHERELTQALEERDRAQDYADQLTNMVGVLVAQDMGEHSNMNEPWENAIEALRVAIGNKPTPLETAAPQPLAEQLYRLRSLCTCEGHSSEASTSGYTPDINCPIHGQKAKGET